MMLPLLLTALAVKPTVDRPPVITGNCNPARVHFTGHISADAAGPVKYTWVRSDKPSTATFTLDFPKPGSLPVTYDWLLIVSPETANSGKVRFEVKCAK
jgi:hypothetical protein